MSETVLAPIIAHVGVSDKTLYQYQGQTVAVGLEVRQHGLWQPQRLLDATEAPQITIIDPLGVVIASERTMVHVNTGHYVYLHQTRFTHPLGMYTARFTVVYRDTYARLETPGVFFLLKGIPALYTYFVIRDSEGTLWYWYIDLAGQLVTQSTQPTDVTRVAKPINTEPVDYIELENPDGFPRYLYPIVTGEILVETVSPMGVPYLGSPVFTAVNGDTYTLEVDMVDQILIIPQEVAV